MLIHDHFDRLERGALGIGIRKLWDGASFSRMVEELLARPAFREGIVYIQVSRGEGQRAHFYPDNMRPTALAYSRHFVFPDAAKKERGIHVITTPDLRWKQCNVKSVNLLANSLAKKKAQRAGAHEALLVGEGIVREGASASF